MEFDLKKIAGLLDKGLEHEAVLKKSRWEKEVVPITRTFLEAIKARLKESAAFRDAPWMYATMAKERKKASSIDSIRCAIKTVPVPGIADRPTWMIGVWIGGDIDLCISNGYVSPLVVSLSNHERLPPGEARPSTSSG